MKRSLVVASTALAIVAALWTAAPSAAAEQLRGTHRGDAYATWANAQAGDIAIRLGRSAYQPCPCIGTGGEIVSNSADHVSSGDVANSRRVATTAQADKTATSAYTRMTARADDTSLLGGQIRAGLVKAVSRTNATPNSIRSWSTGSKFTDLVVLGNALDTVAPNESIDLPGVGRVVLLETKKSGDGANDRALAVNMIHVYVTQTNSFNLPIGSQIVVGHATSGYLRREGTAAFSGHAFATTGTSSSQQARNQLGPSAPIFLGCLGTSGRLESNEINSTSAGSFLTTGQGSTSVLGGYNGTLAHAVATANVENVKLLGGVIRAIAVRGVARTSLDAATSATSAVFDGSGFTGLSVGGLPIGDHVPPNTRIVLPGIGYVVLNEQSNSRSVGQVIARVVMIDVHVTVANDLSLPVGSSIRVAVAASGVQARP